MTQITGIITDIQAPITTKKGTPIQIISVRKNNHSYIYPQIHWNLDILEGFSIGDEVLIDFTIFGKEIESKNKKVQFHTVVIDKIKKL